MKNKISQKGAWILTIDSKTLLGWWERLNKDDFTTRDTLYVLYSGNDPEKLKPTGDPIKDSNITLLDHYTGDAARFIATHTKEEVELALIAANLAGENI